MRPRSVCCLGACPRRFGFAPRLETAPGGARCGHDEIASVRLVRATGMSLAGGAAERPSPCSARHTQAPTHTHTPALFRHTASRGTPQNLGGRIARRALKARPAHEFTATLGEIYTRVGLKTDTEVQTLTRLLHPLHRVPVAQRTSLTGKPLHWLPHDAPAFAQGVRRVETRPAAQ